MNTISANRVLTSDATYCEAKQPAGQLIERQAEHVSQFAVGAMYRQCAYAPCEHAVTLYPPVLAGPFKPQVLCECAERNIWLILPYQRNCYLVAVEINQALGSWR